MGEIYNEKSPVILKKMENVSHYVCSVVQTTVQPCLVIAFVELWKSGSKSAQASSQVSCGGNS